MGKPKPVNETAQLNDLNRKWEQALKLTEDAVVRRPEVYGELKAIILKTIAAPLDIRDYFPTAEKIVALLTCLDPVGKGTIFHRFVEPMSPSNIWHVKWMRAECLDLLDHLGAFEQWRKTKRRLRVVR